eukprot:GHRR01016908.1.p1 GENE.GHRR01016908.1~~GHRR01016908.1.p1  ORF type:complete len:552 (+),score=121.36 GHRR01016908.1:227-1657(+)
MQATVDAVRQHAITAANRYELSRQLLERIPEHVRFVLIGEASHGTKEFYEHRAELTQLLIQERGFTAVLAESDWPDAFRVNRYVLGLDGPLGKPDPDPNAALGDYLRFPRWMWRNTSVAAFIGWLRDHNAAIAAGNSSKVASPNQCRFLGMDVYSLHSSVEAILGYLEKEDPETAKVVEACYRCLYRYGPDAQGYGMATAMFKKASCEQAVRKALADVRRAAEAPRREPGDGPAKHEEALMLEANAMAVKGAEAYYRNMFTRDEVTWNLRDSHFLEVVRLVEKHLKKLIDMDPSAQQQARKPKMVLWAHNSHLGDARETDSGWYRGQLNVGQLMRETYGDEITNIGFTTHTGYVSAADDWGQPVQHKAVRPSVPGSYEHIMHSTGIPCFALDFTTPSELNERLKGPLLERAIGVIYRPRTEMQSHYFDATLPRQFDYNIHHARTTKVMPLEPGDYWAPEDISETKGDMPELWPVGV